MNTDTSEAASLVLLGILFPPIGIAVLLVVLLCVFCFAGGKATERALGHDEKRTPAEAEARAGTVFGWLVLAVMLIAICACAIR